VNCYPHINSHWWGFWKSVVCNEAAAAVLQKWRVEIGLSRQAIGGDPVSGDKLEVHLAENTREDAV
jgi:hypothetical protein